MKSNKTKNRLTKKSFLLGTIASILCSVPLTIGMTEIVKNNESLFSKKYATLDSAVNNAKENAIKETHTLENNNSKWKVTLNTGEVKYFSSPEEMRSSLLSDSIITEETYTSNIDLTTLENKTTGVVDIKNNPNVVKGKIAENSKNIYKGTNSNIYYDESKAKESYFNLTEAYNFNNLYFKNKNDLKDYLGNEYLKNSESTKINSIVLEGPNGVKSNSINLNNKNALSSINDFIESNAQKVLNYKDKINITKNNIDNVLSDITTKDLGLSHVQSNEGESRYIIDNSIDDNYDLIGPYFYKGNLDVGAFMNKNMWKKVNGVASQAYQESEIDKVVGSFFSSIINDDNASNIKESNEEKSDTHLFRTTLKVGEKDIDDWFFEMIGNFNSELRTSLIQTNKDLMQGKKYNTFYKIPILYSFVMQRLFNLKANQKVIDDTINYFKKIGNFIQESIETIVLDKSLLVGKDGSTFDVNTLFHIGNPEFDTNVSTQYFLDNLKTKYPLLVGAMSSYLGGVNNIYMMGGMIPFTGYDQKYLIDFRVMSQDEFNQNKQKYANIYETFSSINFDELAQKFVKYSLMEQVAPLKDKSKDEIIKGLEAIVLKSGISLKDYLYSVGMKNIMMYQLATAALQVELDERRNEGRVYPNGYLAKLHNYGKLDQYAQLVTYVDPNIDIYKAYVAILADAKKGSPIFNSKESIVNSYEFGKNITRLSVEILAFTGLTTNLIKDMYFAYDSYSSPYLSSLTSSLKYNLGRTWQNIKNKIPSTMRTWNVNIPTKFTVKKWSLYGMFTKIDKGLDILKGAAPILGAAVLAFEVFVLVYELLKVETTTNYYVYTTPDGTEFIWNGGRTVSRFFGFDVQQTNGIDSMKLVNPIQITLPQLEEYYYFDGVKYYDPNQGKKVYLNYLLDSNASLNENFSLKYVFADSNNITNADSFKTIDELKDSILKDLNIDKKSTSIDISKINLDSKYLYKVGYKYGNISSFDPDSLSQTQKDEFINDIINNIRETYIVKLPQNLDKDSTLVIPGKVWNSGNTIQDNTSKASEYLISNKANEVDKNNNYLVADKETAKNDAKKELKERFIKAATVQTKKIFMTNDFSLSSIKYEDAKTEMTEKIVYTVFKPGLGTYQFLDKTKAEKFAMNYKLVEKEFTTYKQTSYIYEGKYFANEDALREWIKNSGKY